jgi:hypothetical protein
MIKMKKSLFAIVFVFFALLASAYAVPLDLDNFKIQKSGDSYVAIVTVKNENSDNGASPFATVEATILELGTSKLVDTVNVPENNTEVFTYELSELTESLDSLRRGNDYTVEVKLTDINSGNSNTLRDSFLFGNAIDNGDEILIERVEVDGVEVTNVDSIQVMNGENVEVELRLSVSESLDDARILVFVEGYEHSPIIESTDIFSVVAGVTYTKKLNIQLPSDMDSQKEYKLRITGANDLSGLTYKEYSLYVDTQRDRVDIIDLTITPSTGVEPGQNLVSSVRMKNRGQQIQDSVKVTVAVPMLNIRESSYVSNLDRGDVITSDDMLLYVPEDAHAGQYKVEVTLTYNDGYTATVDEYTLNVESVTFVPEDDLLVSVPQNLELVENREKTFEVVVANPNMDSKPISVAIMDEAWLDVSVRPSLIMIGPGQSEEFRITIKAKAGVDSGEKQLSLVVKEGSTIIDTITIDTFVESDSSGSNSSFNWLNVLLAILLVVLIIVLLLLIVAIARKRDSVNNDYRESEKIDTEEYY